MALDCEKSLISKLIETNDFDTIDRYQIKPTFFTGENKRVYKYILNQLHNLGEIPTVRVIEDKFPDYELFSYKTERGLRKVGTQESMAFWCTELRTKVKHNKLVDLVEDLADQLDSMSTDEAFETARKAFSQLDDDITESTLVKVNDTAEKRKEDYIKRTQTGGMLGISTGSKLLDSITKGWVDGCLITVAGNTGVGKTFWEVIAGCHAVLQGCTVLQFVTEMSTDLMQDRFDAVMFSLLHDKGFSYKLFKSGKLSPQAQKDYFEFLEDELPTLEPYFIETATGVMAMEQKINKLNPDLILVDGAYLMEDDQNARDDWLRVAHITRDLKKLAKRIKKPIIINTQLDEKVAKKQSAKIGDLRYSRAIGEDSDIIIFLIRDEMMINDREMKEIIAKNREGEGGSVVRNWDFTDMDFSDIYTDYTASEDDVSDTQSNTLSVDNLDE